MRHVFFDEIVIGSLEFDVGLHGCPGAPQPRHGLMVCDAQQPRLDSGLLAKTMRAQPHGQEDFLQNLFGHCRFIDQAQQIIVDRRRVEIVQLGKRGFIASGNLAQQLRIGGGNCQSQSIHQSGV